MFIFFISLSGVTSKFVAGLCQFLSLLSSQHISIPSVWQVFENGISYAISPGGQKTGFYADQRENRHFISTISEGQRVLDICCYSGGFALNAGYGGAVNVTGIISSPFFGIFQFHSCKAL